MNSPELLGAWRLPAAGRPPKKKNAPVPPGCFASGDEVFKEQLWLSAAPGCLARESGRAAAWHGFVARSGGSSAAELLQGHARAFLRLGKGAVPPAGHYVCAAADAGERRLLLLPDHAGGERLYYMSAGGFLFFSSSARTLLKAAGLRPELEGDAALENLLCGASLFGPETMLKGVLELKPGECLLAGPGGLERRACWHHPGADIHPAPAGVKPAALKRALMSSVEAALAGKKTAAVALSGGADSSVIAACAAQLLGPRNVRAFTYEFFPGRSEADFAARVCRRLGIRQEVVRVDYKAYREALTEWLWRVEFPFLHPNYVFNVLNLPLSQAAARAGFSDLLTGNGTELALGLRRNSAYLSALGRVAGRSRRPGLLLGLHNSSLLSKGRAFDVNRNWGAALGYSGRGEAAQKDLEAVTGLAGVYAVSDLVWLIYCALARSGRGSAPGVFNPGLETLLSSAAGGARVKAAFAAVKGLTLSGQLAFFEFHHYGLCVGIRDKQRAGGAGARLVSPAIFPAAAALAASTRWTSAADLPRARAVYAAAFGAMLPDFVFADPKRAGAWMAAPESWRADLARDAAPMLPAAARDISARFPGAGRIIFSNSDYSTLLAVWRRMFIERKLLDSPPAWRDLV